jgi:predicted MFS family arabinose efflux permease
LGITQIISWGTLNYSIAVLGTHMAKDFGLSLPAILAAFTGALLISGLLSPLAGRWIDQQGSRPVMASGSLLAAVAFTGMAMTDSFAWLVLYWAMAGAAMALTLYDMAFAALEQVTGSHYRQAITALTLFGGLASTVFWPLSYVLAESIGWRSTVLLFAATHLLVCLPLHLVFLHSRIPSTAVVQPADPQSTDPQKNSLRETVRHRKGLYWLTSSFTLIAIIFSSLAVHMIATLEAFGLSADDAILLAAAVGPMQVLGRIIEFSFGQALSATRIATITMALMLLSLIFLLCVMGSSPAAWGFAIAYGASNGVMTIVRGSLPAELYGRDGYGALLGFIAGPSFIGKAVAPFGFALLATASGYSLAIAGLAMLCLIALIAFQIAIRTAEPHPPVPNI